MINQDAYLSLGEFDEISTNHIYQLNSNTNGLFLMVIEGNIEIESEILETRDSIMVSGIDQIRFSVKARTRLLAIEVPMLFR